MNSTDPTESPTLEALLDLSELQRIEVVCERFEQAAAERDRDIATYCHGFEGTARDYLAKELLAIDIEMRLRRGEAPSEADYQSFDAETVAAQIRIAGQNQTLNRQGGGSRPLRLEVELGTQIGPYSLVERIGEGGMGTVYRACQENPIRREVALKVIRSELASPEVIRRFERERQALAAMAHPNIAQVLDVGETPGGFPFMVMELVHGVSITDYCAAHSLTLRQRLELFLEVCNAVQHAHQKGIIHRDLKPSNVLVAELDERSIPKVIDFGLAKVLESGSDMRHEETRHGMVMGTFQYMAPELAGEATGIADTRSDVFALGALLYELLTGRPSLGGDRLSGSSLLEILQIVRDHEPSFPSRALARSEQPFPNRSLKSSWIRKLSGDLDWIVLKSLARSPEKRYASVSELATDIKRYLEGQSVSAHKPSVAGQMIRLTRRHPIACSVLSVLFVCLVIGLTAGAVAYRQILHERDLAKAAEVEAQQSANSLEIQLEKTETARKKAAAMGSYFTDVLHLAAPDKLGRDATVVEALKHTATTFEQRFQNDAAAKYELMGWLALTFLELGEIREAELYARKRWERFQTVYGDEHERTLHALNSHYQCLLKMRRFEDAESEARQLRELAPKVFGSEDPRSLVILNNYATLLASQGKYALAEPELETVLQMRERVLGTDDTATLRARLHLATVRAQLGQHDKALKESAGVLAAFESRFGQEHPETLIAWESHARILASVDVEQAIDRELKLIARCKSVFGVAHPHTIRVTKNVGVHLIKQQQFDQGIDLLLVVHSWNAEHGSQKGVVYPVDLLLIAALCEVGNGERAEAIARKSLVALRSEANGSSKRMLEVTLGLARSLISQSKFDESRELLNEAKEKLASGVDDKELDGIAMSLLGEIHLKSGEIAAGQALIEKAAKLLPLSDAADHDAYSLDRAHIHRLLRSLLE